MGTYITHEGLPFHGALEKIRIRSCRVADLSLPGFDEKQLLEITRDGTAKLTQKTPEGTKKAKTRISQADTDYIFAAFSETFANYRRKRIPSVSGHWRVRLLTDDDEVYFYHGANGQDYRYHDESLTDILRQRTGMPELFGLCVKAETKNKVKSIEISLEQTAADEVKDQYVNEYGICIHDTNEWLLVSSEGTITYNRRIAMGFARENGVPNAFDEVRHIFGYNNKYGVDFVDNTRKVCMEYNGVYWHKDKKRVDCYKFIKIHNAGYTFIRILEPGLKAFDKKYDIVLPKNYKHGNEYESKIMEDLGYKLISLFEEIYNYKATPEIQKLVDFKEFEKWYDIHRKRISAKATDNAAKKVA